jgi:hypothetical protein
MIAPISDLDDLFVHQTQYPLAQPATTDMRFFERCYFGIHDREGRFALASGLGSYPNMGSMDGFGVGVTRGDSMQYNGRFFRELHGDRIRTEVGPLRFDILEPMRRWRLRLNPNPYGVAFDLEMKARFERWDTRISTQRGLLMLADFGHFVQSCRFQGRVEIGDRVFEGDFVGCRDRSYGLRPLGGLPTPGNGPSPTAMHLWLNPQFEDSAWFVSYFDRPAGDSGSLHGGIRGGKYDGRTWISLEHELTLREGIRVHESGIVRLTDNTGHVHELRTRAALPGIYLLGAGYVQGHPDPRHGWSTQGKFMGDHQEGETYDVGSSSVDLLSQYRADFQADQPAYFSTAEGEEGYGVMEYSFAPTYQRYPANSFKEVS